MDKKMRFIYLLFAIVISFLTFNNNINADDELDCTNKLLRCEYPVEIKSGLSTHKYLVDCYINNDGSYECKMYCRENCSKQGYNLKSYPNISMFVGSTNNYQCPETLEYRTVNNSSDDVYFKLDASMDEDPTYKFDKTAKLNDYCRGVNTSNSVVTSCGMFGNNYDKISITSTKNVVTNTFSYSADYSVGPNKYKVSNIDEIMKSQKIDENGCPTGLTFHTIVQNGDGTYSIELNKLSGDPGENTYEEYSGWSGWTPENGWKDPINGSAAQGITIQNLLKISSGKIVCTGLRTMNILSDVFRYIRLAGIILFVILTSVDYVKCIVSSDSSMFKKANERVVKRVIILIVILMLPAVIRLISNMISLSNGTCGVA